MIDYVEIREKETRELIGIVDTAKSIIWKSVYYGVGEFEIYAIANSMNISMLVEDNYVTRPPLIYADGTGRKVFEYECGIIEHVEITDDSNDGKMIVASGRFVKSILDRRVIYYATLVPPKSGTKYYWSCSASVLSGNVETAVRKLIYDNAIDAYTTKQDNSGNPIVVADTARNISEIHWTDDDITDPKDDDGESIKIVTQDDSGETSDADKQVTYKNLLEYTDAVLQEYECGARMWLDIDLLKFRYQVYKGVDRSRNSTTNQPIIFSKEFDNLVSSNYTTDNSAYKTTALIGGEGEGEERKCAFAYAWVAGLERRETFVDASSISSTYTDETTGEETSYEMDVYRKQLETQGRQTIAELQKTETFDGEIDLTNSTLVYGKDYNLGDMVTVEDKDMDKYIDVRILTVTEVQDDDGYKIDIEYGI